MNSIPVCGLTWLSSKLNCFPHIGQQNPGWVFSGSKSCFSPGPWSFPACLGVGVHTSCACLGIGPGLDVVPGAPPLCGCSLPGVSPSLCTSPGRRPLIPASRKTCHSALRCIDWGAPPATSQRVVISPQSLVSPALAVALQSLCFVLIQNVYALSQGQLA